MSTNEYIYRRVPFMQFVIMLTFLVLGVLFALSTGFPQQVAISDLSHMAIAIAVFAAASIAYIGYQTWALTLQNVDAIALRLEWGYESADYCPLLGIIGTIVGLYFQANAGALSGGNLQALGTSFYCTMVGAGAWLAIRAFTYNLSFAVGRLEGGA